MKQFSMEIRETSEGTRYIIQGLRIPPEGISMERVEEALIREALTMTGGNQIKAAKLLDISRDALRYRMQKFGIDTVRNHSFHEGDTEQHNTDAVDLPDVERIDYPERTAGQVIAHDRRRFDRKRVGCPACMGDTPSSSGEYAMGTILDISIGGIRFSIPKGTELGITADGGAIELSISFTLPNHHWPIGVKCRSKRVVESGDEVQIGATIVDTDIRSYHAMQQYLN